MDEGKEHFSKNNPDMKLDFPKPTYDEINDMAKAKGRGYPITSKNDVTETVGEQMYMASDGSGELETAEDVAPLWNVDWLKTVKMTGSEEDKPEA